MDPIVVYDLKMVFAFVKTEPCMKQITSRLFLKRTIELAPFIRASEKSHQPVTVCDFLHYFKSFISGFE